MIIIEPDGRMVDHSLPRTCCWGSIAWMGRGWWTMWWRKYPGRWLDVA